MATAAAKATTDARARSIELAQARGETPCSWAARTTGWTLDEQSGALVSLALAIYSAHDADTVYAVGYDARRDDASCDCPAARYGQRHGCWHRGLGIVKGRSVARLYAPAGRAEAARASQADLAAEENARALGY
jgi:hypothetical protein